MPHPPRLRIGVIGFAHMHVNALIEDVLAAGADLIACADTIPQTPSLTRVEGSRHANLARALNQPGNPKPYADHHAMLEIEKLHLVLFCPEISRHADIAEAIAAHKIPMLTEKPLAATTTDATRMIRAANAAQVPLITNWSITWRAPIRRVKSLIDEGAIGEILQFRWRNMASLGPLAIGSNHPGATTIGAVTDAEKAAEWWHQSNAGGGALLDYACYGACLATWFLGAVPDSVTATTHNLRHQFSDAEDNATLLLHYPRATALIEASWTTVHNGTPNGPILHGTTGTIVVDGPRVLLYRKPGTAPEIFENDPIEAPATIGQAVIAHLQSGTPLHATLAPNLNQAVAAILEAGARAAASGQRQAVKETVRF